MTNRHLSVLALVLAFAGPAGSAAPPDSDFRHEEEKWRAERLERLKSEDGWLTLVGLHWLEEGENRFGSDPASAVPLPPGAAPPKAGSFFLGGGKVRVEVAQGVEVLLDGQPVTERVLRTDESGKPDTLRLGRLSFLAIKRGERHAIRVRDPESPARKRFRGLEYFPADPRWRVTAVFTPYETPREVQIPTALGTTDTMKAPGLVKFVIDGKELSLEPYGSLEDEQLFFIFKDATSGKATYPAGRYVYTDVPRDGTLVLDFNQAFNPPCAFTPYATCPYPPKSNWLPVPIEAGERKYGE